VADVLGVDAMLPVLPQPEVIRLIIVAMVNTAVLRKW
jgi:hypothetical protein